MTVIRHGDFLIISPEWCEVERHAPSHPKPPPSVAREGVERLSISLSSDDKKALERIAATKKVSLARVIRDAGAIFEGGARNPMSALEATLTNVRPLGLR
jgi:hypothetical protein